MMKWLQAWELKGGSLLVEESDNLPPLESSVEWRTQVVERTDILSQFIGKTAARLWICGTIDKFNRNYGSFILALKYYFKQERGKKSLRDEFRELASTRFSHFIEWAEDAASCTPKAKPICSRFRIVRPKVWIPRFFSRSQSQKRMLLSAITVKRSTPTRQRSKNSPMIQHYMKASPMHKAPSADTRQFNYTAKGLKKVDYRRLCAGWKPHYLGPSKPRGTMMVWWDSPK